MKLYLFYFTILQWMFKIALCKERTASLVVLPPLVLGYDELYTDYINNNQNDSDEAKEVVNENKATNGTDDNKDAIETDNQSKAGEKPTSHETKQRSINRD